MKFRTELLTVPAPVKITHQDPVFMIGSCFTEHIGGRLKNFRFPTTVNPFGILFNPLSVCSNLLRAMRNAPLEERAVLNRDNRWYSWHHHSSISSPGKEALIQQVDNIDRKVNAGIKESAFLFITLGSAWVYRYRELDLCVANCHKVPGGLFDKYLLSAGEIVTAFKELLGTLAEVNPAIKVIFTVSPVRHVRDGLVENNRSKAALITAAHELCSRYDNCFYFPAYELIVDDLRDYRFYEQDLVHPNKMAADYVWEHFIQAYIDPGTRQVINRISRILAAEGHRPIIPDAGPHEKFLGKIAEEKKALEKEYHIRW